MSVTAVCVPGRASVLLTPGNDLTGQPGDVVGWGFGFGNTEWSVLTFSEFLPQGPPAGVLGNYQDFISLPQNFYDVPPGFPLVVPFNGPSQAGIGEFVISPGDAPGTVIAWTLRLYFDTYFGDPDVGAVTDTLDNTLDVPVSITVTQQTPDTSVPEPALTGVLGFCFGFVVFTAGQRRYFKNCSSGG
jgi:hypothetical protein